MLSSLLFAACGESSEPIAAAGGKGGSAADAGGLGGNGGADASSGAGGSAAASGGSGGSAAAAGAPADAAVPATLSSLRQALYSGYASSDTCAAWDGLNASEREVFLTLTHRLFLSKTPDGASMLEHMTKLWLIRGGGNDGSTCGGSENNRLFLSMSAYLWQHMVTTWQGTTSVTDGGGAFWAKTADIAGPHSPFDASNETETGLRCTLLIETSGSKPPTAQAHFFQDGSAVPVKRGPIDLPSDPHMLEIDHDFDCIHRSNPTCSNFINKYVSNYGDYQAGWRPEGC